MEYSRREKYFNFFLQLLKNNVMNDLTDAHDAQGFDDYE